MKIKRYISRGVRRERGEGKIFVLYLHNVFQVSLHSLRTLREDILWVFILKDQSQISISSLFVFFYTKLLTVRVIPFFINTSEKFSKYPNFIPVSRR